MLKFNLKKHISLILEEFKKLDFKIKILVILVIVLGTIIRFVNLSNLGFAYDTVMQYTWAQAGLKMGYYEFWRGYTEFFDYLPGSLLLLMLLKTISNIFGGSAEAFVTILKSFNWICDVALILLTLYIAAKYAKYSPKKLFLLGSLMYIIPSLWFVSSVWGQMDTFVILLVLISSLLLYEREQQNTDNRQDQKSFYKDLAFLSGLILGIGFWIKMQTILTFPILFVYHASLHNSKVWKRQVFGFLISTVLIIAIPAVSNIMKLASVSVQPFARADNVSNGAATFWSLVGMTGKGSDKLFEFFGVGPSVTISGLIIYIVLMLSIYMKMINRNLFEMLKSFSFSKTFMQRLFPERLSFVNFVFLSLLNSSLYFMFFTKMHSRYLHMGIIFSFLALACLKAEKAARFWVLSVVILSLSYFINQVGVYAAWNNNPAWVNSLLSSIKANPSPFLSTMSLTIIYILVWKSFHRNPKS